jgi:methyltransferase (TIGR00027 family)
MRPLSSAIENLRLGDTVEKISETAFLVAMYRAIETERPDALIRDPLARRLAGGQGALQSAVLGPMPQGVNAIALRTRAMDDLIEQLVRSAGIDGVMNLAAGLDARPYRLPLPPTLQWIEVDLPEILAYKTQTLQGQQANCALERVALDLRQPQRNQFFTKANSTANRSLVITEGLLGYLSTEEVAALAVDLQRQPNFRWWLLELLPPLQQNRKLHGQRLFEQYFTGGAAAFQFAPKEGAAFFQSYGWRVVEVRSIWKESRRLKRGVRAAWLWEWLLKVFARQQWRSMNNSGIVLLERE